MLRLHRTVLRIINGIPYNEYQRRWRNAHRDQSRAISRESARRRRERDREEYNEQVRLYRARKKGTILKRCAICEMLLYGRTAGKYNQKVCAGCREIYSHRRIVKSRRPDDSLNEPEFVEVKPRDVRVIGISNIIKQRDLNHIPDSALQHQEYPACVSCSQLFVPTSLSNTHCVRCVYALRNASQGKDLTTAIFANQ